MTAGGMLDRPLTERELRQTFEAEDISRGLRETRQPTPKDLDWFGTFIVWLHDEALGCRGWGWLCDLRDWVWDHAG